MIDSLITTRVFAEKKVLNTITINSTVNSNGKLMTDDRGNDLISSIDSGDTYIYRISKYSGDKYILLYNEKDFTMRIGKEGDIINMPINFNNGTKYLMDVEIVKGTRGNKNSFSLDIKNKKIFKVFLDCGKEIKTYTFQDDTLTIMGSDTYYLDDFSEISVYIYSDTIEEVTLEYYNFSNILPSESYCESDNFVGIELTTFEDINLSQSKTQHKIKYDFKNKEKNITNSIENSISLDLFSYNGITDFVQYIKSDEFRLIFINQSFGRTVLINNCTLNTVNLAFEKQKNKKTISIDCGNYIDILIGGDKEYGIGNYGEGNYGGDLIVYNSRYGG